MKLYKAKDMYYRNAHKWFAWYPVWVIRNDGEMYRVWLEYVIKKDGLVALYDYEFLDDDRQGRVFE